MQSATRIQRGEVNAYMFNNKFNYISKDNYEIPLHDKCMTFLNSTLRSIIMNNNKGSLLLDMDL